VSGIPTSTSIAIGKGSDGCKVRGCWLENPRPLGLIERSAKARLDSRGESEGNAGDFNISIDNKASGKRLPT